MTVDPTPRGLLVAAASSHSGKTTVTIGLIAALRELGLSVAAAKCGPDYLDPRFLEAASGGVAINVDPWAMGPDRVRVRLAAHAAATDILVVEGVMGLFDGGAHGAGSTAELARITGLPVLLVVSAQGMAQSAAAIAEGFARMADGIRIVGAVVNGVGSERHARLIREGFARASVPLVGLVRRDPGVALPSRHLGLVQAEEHVDLASRVALAGRLVADGCDLDSIIGSADRILPAARAEASAGRLVPLGQRVAVARDRAFGFAYPHLLSDWRGQGAEIRFFSPLADEPPDAEADAVFLPGGYPELHGGTLAAADRFRAGMGAAAGRGALIYGECGGYMSLGESLIDAEGREHRMLGLLPLSTSFARRKLHLGYRRLMPLADLPWPSELRGHEFHYATILREGDAERLFAAETSDGEDLGAMGLRRGRVMGSFAHVIDAAPL
ncbi:hydrogenobyrinic acid a,c-diamide synthase (glutamine-hydrolysing) /cobyrinate a,c-diamide synthase [Faunimonas pinastri]|uniref:Hydrogenobyrinate a,c-diamide synthase n=1 Tax=Faunimonas pinastri TaxID=1855383 RepID=A0A1H9LYU5_9HYPH|nr:cobyrinate a,c-diamide synthase [Faunimonas pinastri]SER16582.1 hydrogenobyrinic acid a,c-diamide synthase (glutamine-hydrolysing) /cobyrinate a,c-diamide synthase [Faunimonas pinastri]